MDHAFDVDVVHNLAHVRHHLPGKLELAEAERPAAALAAAPAQKEANHLPERVEPQASRHHRIALEMATEEPKIRLHIEFGADPASAEPLLKSRWSIFERKRPVSRRKRASYHGLARIPQVRIAPAALAFAEIAKLSPRALYHRPPRTAKHHDGGKSPRPVRVPSSCEKLASNAFPSYI